MISYIDLSGCSEVVRKRFKRLSIPVRLGRHKKDIDVLEEELPKEYVDYIRNMARENHKGKSGTLNEDWPIGFDLKQIPVGAVLHLEV